MKEFLNELLIRFFTEKPQFFKVVQAIGVFAAVLTGLPVVLETYGMVLPESIQSIANETISIASLVATFVAQLTTTTKDKKREGLED
jgi:hypothetical protein